jgi:lipopolysaccharide/colanic/teichoic acid biosynthesis glycosyltransferase
VPPWNDDLPCGPQRCQRLQKFTGQDPATYVTITRPPASEAFPLKNLSGVARSHARGRRRRLSQARDRANIPINHWCNSSWKRIFDVFWALLLLIFVFPALVLIAVLIRFSTSGPVLFRQVRLGRGGAKFEIFKFRTMEHDGHQRHSHITAFGDPRVTRIGGVLRKWKLDELPQLFNVLRGDMSFVGPRPRVPQQEQELELLRVRPGVTSMATLAFSREESLFEGLAVDQIKEMYTNTIIPLKVQLDRSYLEKATVFSDLNLMFRTVVSVSKYSHAVSTREELSGMIDLSKRNESLELALEGD